MPGGQGGARAGTWVGENRALPGCEEGRGPGRQVVEDDKEGRRPGTGPGLWPGDRGAVRPP